MQFEVLANEIVIGHSSLELGDAPMGVAEGAMIPTAAYLEFQSLIVAANGSETKGVELAVRVAGDSQALPSAGVVILDVSAELDEPPRVTVFGIPYPQYEQLFAAHVALYATQFSAGGA